MSKVEEYLARLTGFRDRDVLDATLVGALRDLLQPLCVAIYRCVGEPGAQHWMTRARMLEGDVTASADPLWTDLASLPLLHEYPERHACLLGQESRVVGGEQTLHLFPLATDREGVGVLEIHSAKPLSRRLKSQVCNILRIYRNFEGLLDYSERDNLTGLLNRQTFDASFHRTAAVALAAPVTGTDVADDSRRAGGGGRPWLGVIDIDHFKVVNDSFGHLIGDEVLLLLSRLMHSCFRYHDRLYRFGGEEFVVLLRCGGVHEAAQAFERLRHGVEGYGFPRVGRITVSIGFTEVQAGDTPTSAFERADKAVYHAKDSGRNQVV
ncbi:MAG: GGDEF domain-containing protein, partial [Rubrivivax sp.]|nr:GGDEF domain-containing protein [Rubrivivax sp.]